MISAAPLCRPFLDRDDERAFVRERVQASRAGSGGIVGISGSGGSGKSRFLAEVRREIPDGVRVIRSACYAFAPAPYAPFSDILRELGGDDGRRLPDAARLRTRLAPIVPEFGDGIATGVAQRDAFAAVDRVLRASAGDGLALLIEDLHDADAGTLDLLRYLASDLGSAPVTVIATYRDDDAPPSFIDARTALERAPAWRRVTLGPLPDPVIDRLIVEVAGSVRLPRRDRERIVAAAQGNPLLAEELVRTAIEDPSAPAPRTIRDAVRARLTGLDSATRRVLAVVAQAATGIDGATLGVLVPEMTPGVLAVALDAALAAGLLHRDRHDPSCVGFRHALMRDVVAGELVLPDAAAINAILADRLAAAPDAAAHLAQIALHRARSGDRAAASAAWEAAADEAAQRFAHTDAAAWYSAALDGESDPVRRLALIRRRAEATQRSGERAAAAIDLAEAATLARDVRDDDALGRILVQLARASYFAGDPVAAARHYTDAAELATARDDRALAFQALAGLAEFRVLSGDVDAAETALADAEAFRLAAAGTGSVIYHVARAQVAALRGDEDAWRRHAGEAMESARGMAPPEVDTVIAVSINTGAQAAFLGLFDEAITRGEWAAASTRTFRMFGFLGYALASLADAYLSVGRLVDARAAVREGLRASAADEVDELNLASVGVDVAVATGDAELLAALPDPFAALERAVLRGEPTRIMPVAAAAAGVAAARGDRDTAAEAIRRGLTSGPLTHATTGFIVAAARYGGIDDVAALDAALGRGEGPPVASAYGRAHLELARAVVARRRGDARAAAHHGDRALPSFVRLGAKLDEAHARGAIEPREGDRAYRALGVAFLAPSAEDPKKRKRPTGPLSEREAEIAGLVADGASNKEIAAQLHLSERTVEHHVAAILQKLALRRRAEVAARRAQGW